MSSVSAIRPSVEFSSGTIPNWTCRRLTSSKTAAIEPTGTCSTPSPNLATEARWL